MSNPHCPNNYTYFTESFCIGESNSEKITYSILISLYLCFEISVAVWFFKKSKKKEMLLCEYSYIRNGDDVTYSYLSMHILWCIRW